MIDDVFERARRALHDHGPMAGDELVGAVGIDPEDVDAVDELLGWATEEGIWTLGLDTYLLAEHVLEGTRCTRVVTAEELAEGRLRIDADLELTTWASSRDEATGPLGLEHGDEGSFLVGPPGWLDGVAAGSMVAVGWRDGAWTVEPVAQDELVAGDLPARLRRAFEACVGGDDVAICHTLFGWLAIEPDRPFATLRPPLTTLLAEAGLEVHGYEVADAGFDWEARVAAQRDEHIAVLAHRHGLTRARAELLHDLGQARPEPVQVLAALADGEVVSAYLEEHLEGPFGAVRARFADDLLDVTVIGDSPPPGAHLLAARLAEHAGDVEGFARGVAAALAGDRELEPAQFDAAFLASWRGDAAAAVEHRRRAGVSRDDEPTAFLRPFAAPPPGVSRNAPCPCGSGRKAKLCCLDSGSLRHPLLHRSHWLYEKLADGADRPPFAPRVLTTASELVGVDSWEDPVVFLALAQPCFWTIALFETGLVDEVLDRYGALLPPDEAALAERWRGIRHRLVTLEDLLPGVGARVRDLVSGEGFEVTARFNPGAWKVGEDCLALLAPVDGKWVPLGQPVPVPQIWRDDLLPSAEQGSDEVARRVFVALLGAEVLVLEQQRAERIAFALPGVDPDEVDIDDEDLLGELVEEWHGPVPDVEVSEELHLTLHKIVAVRLIADEPPGIWDEAQRLLRRGHDRHDVLHHLMDDVAREVYAHLR
jgi:hypothetical protein